MNYIQINRIEDLVTHGISQKPRCKDPGAWCTIDEALALYTLLRAQNIQTVYESGTCNGWSASWAALAGCEVYTYDIEIKPQIYEGTSLEHMIHQTISPFHKGVKEIIGDRPNHPIAVFIDGDHNTESCQADLDAVVSYLRVNDLLFFHDTKRARYDGILKIYESLTQQGMYEGINFVGTRNGIAVVRKKHKR
jgi:cephalosporin hydroxylase